MMLSIEELKIALRVRNDAEDTYIQMLHDAAIAIIERDTGEYYGPIKAVTEVVNVPGSIVWLLSTPREITAVTAYEGGTWSPVTAYRHSGRRMVFDNANVMALDRRIEYTTGYDDEAIPADVQLRITQLVTLWFEQRLPVDGLLGVQQSVIGHPGGI